MNTHEKLLVHPQPVDKTAALHIAGGDKLGREELLWAQREQFERAMTNARLHNMAEEQEHRRKLARAAEQLETLREGSFYRRDWKKHTRKLYGKVLVAGKREDRIRERAAEGLAT